MIAPLDLAQLLPHSGRMVMIDRVSHWDPDSIVCTSTRHLDPTNPLRGRRGLAAVCGLEFGAQAMAIHGSLVAARSAVHSAGAPRFGMIIAANQLAWSSPLLDDAGDQLTIRAWRLFGSDNQIVYGFALDGRVAGLVTGRASVILAAPADGVPADGVPPDGLPPHGVPPDRATGAG
jgi:predicted hotdog family 3-hydroxylacyl-ACP dehydratase